MRNNSCLISLLLVVSISLVPLKSVFGHRLEISGGLGYTAVDLNAWAESGVSDWNQLLYTVNAQLYFYNKDAVEFGAELGHTYFMWYTVPLFSGLREPSAVSVSGLLRYKLTEQLFAELSAGVYFFGDWTDPGVRTSLGYMIPINEKLSVPLKFQLGMILDSSANLYTVDLSGGVAYSF